VEHDGCSVCHNPHGSVNTRLLVERDYNLCLKCHYSNQYQSVGHYAHRRALNPASIDPTGRTSLCTGCHRGVHGSNFSKELRTQ
jgi:predicted CXXCH cytochrome family protein